MNSLSEQNTNNEQLSPIKNFIPEHTLHKLDFFSNIDHIYINKSLTFKTVLGSVLTIILVFGNIFLFYCFSQKFFNKTNPKINSNLLVMNNILFEEILTNENEYIIISYPVKYYNQFRFFKMFEHYIFYKNTLDPIRQIINLSN